MNRNEILNSIRKNYPPYVGFCLFLIICFISAMFFVNLVVQRQRTLERINFLTRVRILAAAVDIDKVKALTGSVDDEIKPQYIRLRQQLSKVIESNPKMRYAYMMGMRDGQVIFLVENIETEEEEEGSNPGDIYYEASDELKDLFNKGDGLIEGPLADRWGTWVSALVPIRDDQTHETLAVLGLDIDADVWEEGISFHRSYAIALSAFFFSIIIVIFFFSQRHNMIALRMKISEERFRHVADSSGDWIWETDPNGLYTYCSRAVKDILGYEAREVIGKKYFYDFCLAEEKKIIQERAERQSRERVNFFHEIGNRQHRDGRMVILEIKGYALRHKDGRLLGYRGIDRDITEQRRIEEEIMNLAKFPLENPNQVLRIDQNGLILYANKASERFLKHWKRGIGETMPSDWIELTKDCLRLNQVKEFEITLSERVYAFAATPVKQSNYVNIYGSDITEKKKMQESLEENRLALEAANRDLEINEKALRSLLKDMEQANRELKETQDKLIQSEKMATVGTLSTGIAHEVKNPLAIILQGIERIEKDFNKSKTINQQYVTMVRDAAVRANKVVQALLKFSRSSKLEMETIDIHKVIDATVDLIASEASARNVEIICDYPEDDIYIPGDQILLQQVFLDLFKNAVDAMPEGGTLSVMTHLMTEEQEKRMKRMLIVKVADTGIGIAPEAMARVFDPFFTTKEVGEGTGLGLSTVYLILERHEATISVQSKQNEGTVFTLTFPLS
ncbi:MAG: PAS domain S-box protein [Candidatus Omnitrophota bacterium]